MEPLREPNLEPPTGVFIPAYRPSPLPSFLGFLWMTQSQAITYLALAMTLNFARMAIPKASVGLLTISVQFGLAWLVFVIYRPKTEWPTRILRPKLSWASLTRPLFWMTLSFWMLVASFLFAATGLLSNGRAGNPAIGDVQNLLYLLFWLAALRWFVPSKADFLVFMARLRASMAFFGILAAVLGLIKWTWALTAGTVPDFLNLSAQPMGTSLVTDYNYYTLFLLAGLVCFMAPFTPQIWQNRPKWLTFSIVTLFATAIIASGSRRGVIALLLMVAILLIQGSLARRSVKVVHFGNFGRPLLLGFVLGHMIVGGVWLAGLMLPSNAPRIQFGLITYRYASLIPKETLEPAPNFAVWHETLFGQPPSNLAIQEGFTLLRKAPNASKNIDQLRNLWFWKPGNGNGRPPPTDSRTDRWLLAITRWQANPKLFGEGFSTYPYAFADHFKTGLVTDHPHSPFFNALLYGGVTAAAIYLLWILTVVWGYAKGLFRSPDLQTWWPVGLIALGYSMTSDFSPFSAPLTTFLLVLPMLYYGRQSRLLDAANPDITSHSTTSMETPELTSL